MARIGVVPSGKQYMKASMAKATDYLAARKLISKVNRGQSLSYFDKNYILEERSKDEEFSGFFDKLLVADKNGMYVSVFLNELRKLAEKLFPEPATDEIRNEINGFLKHLYSLCQKESENLVYNGCIIKTVVAFTGTNEKLRTKGYEYYVDRCYKDLNLRVNTVYLFALGAKRDDAIAIENRFHEKYPNYTNTSQTKYIHTSSDHHKANGICIEFEKCYPLRTIRK